MVYKEQYLINEIRKYIQNENEIIQFIDDFRKEPYHFKETFYHAIINKKTIVLCMHGSKEEIQLPYITAYLKGNRTINKVKKWMHLFQIQCIYVIVTLQKGRIAQQMREQLQNEIMIHFTIDEELCHRLCITYPKDTIIITHAKKEDQLFQTLSKYFPCYELGEEIQTSKKEVVVVPMLLQSGKHYEVDVKKSLEQLILEDKRVTLLPVLLQQKEYLQSLSQCVCELYKKL